jgi:hypothetical protein
MDISLSPLPEKPWGPPSIPPIIMRALSLETEQLEHEADQPHAFSAKVNDMWHFTFLSQTLQTVS